ncbi:MAG: class I SAM-dependent rRNA methyltransferase [Bacteroidales bacterium]|nr:class I SAM-dependent rRNA methyltransferase [Bacteroidales bacterium]
MPIIYLKPRKEDSLLRFHPWVFSGAIAYINGTPEEGGLVLVRSAKGDSLGIGHYQIGSIAVRILEFFTEELPAGFWHDRIRAAYAMREAIGLISNDNNTYRLVHGEGDFLPGLVVDIYDDTAVLQAHSVGMHYMRHELAQAIVDVVPAVKNVYYKSEGTLPYKAQLKDASTDMLNGYLIGAESACLAKENGLIFGIDWLRGQKTGFFVDQRENRMLLQRYARGKNVLNMFCYTGGFSVYALRGGANLVHSVDSSAIAVDLVNQNVLRNFPDTRRHEAFVEDAFRYLEKAGDAYDLIILDPPAFAKHRGAVRNALQGYKRLNAKAFEKIRPGGILFTFSCSQAVDKDMFRLAVFSAAAMSKRKVRILHQLTQPQDHPVNIYHPEGEYLKGLVLWVE